MLWNRERLYRPYKEWPVERLDELKKRVKKSKWRMKYHIQPTTGLLNDPNGFSFFNNEWHLFYQAFPYGTLHGLKSWVHLTSKDLVNWKNLGPALIPDSPQDKQGAYSGSAIQVDGKLFIMYTGNVRNEDWTRHPKQNGAWLDKNNDLVKMVNPLISEPPKHFTEQFRDPQIIKHGEYYYAFIGAQKNDLSGHVLVYKTKNISKNWTYEGKLQISDKKMGFMIECPSLVFIKNQPVLIFCPQGLDHKIVNYKNIYPNVYVIGESFDWKTLTVVNPGKIYNLDDGFDCYATQAINAPKNRVLSISWVGMPETEYPTKNDGWENCLSLVKELTIRNGKLYQKPVKETESLFIKNTSNADYLQLNSKVNFYVPKNQIGKIKIITDYKGKKALLIKIDSQQGKVEMDRGNAGVGFAEKFGTIRSTQVKMGTSISGSLYIDNSVFELFINDGERVMTGRFFPTTSNFELETNGFGEGFEINSAPLNYVDKDY